MAIKELDAGESHQFPPTALRLQVTGAKDEGQVLLSAVNQAGQEQGVRRLKRQSVVVLPQPRRLRLVVRPGEGGVFPGGLRLGLSVRTEGSSTHHEEVLITPVDVGALVEFEVGVLEFATNRAILSVAKPKGPPDIAKPHDGKQPINVTDGDQAGPTRRTGTAVPGRPFRDDDDQPWLEAGRYALRDARQHLGRVPEPAVAWGLVIDGSASMRRRHTNGGLTGLVGLVAGVMVEWTKLFPTLTTAGLVRAERLSGEAPEMVVDQVFGDHEPASVSSLGRATAEAAEALGGAGALIVVTDGVPADLDVICRLAASSPDLQIVMVSSGHSVWGLPRDRGIPWWQEELGGFALADSTANLTPVAVLWEAEVGPVLSEGREAELAQAITIAADPGPRATAGGAAPR